MTITFDKPIVQVPALELRAAFGDILKWDSSGACTDGMNSVGRAIVYNELEFPSETAIRDLRDIWYSTVKPVFTKLGMLKQPMGGKMSEQTFLKKRSDVLQGVMRDLVAKGEITYRQLGVIDHSRAKQRAVDYVSHGELPSYSVSFGEYPWLVLATEKDTQYAELLNIAALYGCSAISGSGQSSCAAVEGLLESLIPPDEYGFRQWNHYSKEIVFLPFTDYDGHGFDIANTFETQMRDCIANLDVRVPNRYRPLVTVRTQRLGLNLDQLTPEEVIDNVYALPNNKVNRDWFEETGGVEGRFLGLELNAMKHEQRIKIITDALNTMVDPRTYNKRLRIDYARKVAIEAIVEIIDGTVYDAALRHTAKHWEESSGFSQVPEPEITLDMVQVLALKGVSQFSLKIEGAPDEDIKKYVLQRIRERLMGDKNSLENNE